jgi:hypothetical protein
MAYIFSTSFQSTLFVYVSPHLCYPYVCICTIEVLKDRRRQDPLQAWERGSRAQCANIAGRAAYMAAHVGSLGTRPLMKYT